MKRILLTLTIWTSILTAHHFPFDLSEKIGNDTDNWMFSPYSISTCLAMAELGAKGQTSNELRQVLDIETTVLPQVICHKPINDLDFDLRIVQGLWVKRDFSLLDSYANAVRNSYQAIAENVDFSSETREKINSWVAKNTENKIQNLLPSISSETQMILANALYFKGSWISPFSSSETHMRVFYPSTGSKTPISFMHQTNSFSYSENEEAQAVMLPFYSQSETCEPACLLILPRKNQKITEALFESLYRNMTFQRVKLAIPKLSLTTEVPLTNPLKHLGMGICFSDSADFSNIDGRGELKLSDVLHKAYFEMDENGVEAAAATIATMTSITSLPIERRTTLFIADHPFYILLIDRKTDTILFFGKYQNPKRG